MKLLLLLGPLGLASAAAAQQPGGYQISGQHPRLAGQMLYVLKPGRPLQVLDSARADAAGSFVLSGQVPAPDVYFVRVNHERSLHPVPLANQERLTAVPSKRGVGESNVGLTFSGSPEVTLWDKAMTYKFFQLQLKVADASDRELRAFEALLRANATSYITPYFAYRNLRMQPGSRPLLDSLTRRFEAEQPASPYLPRLREALAAGASLDVGALAPDLTLPGPDGKNVVMSSLRGQWVLLDFWASWCKPCRAENPSLRAAYDKFAGKKPGFTILAVSVDTDRARWLEAVQADALPWPQASDLLGTTAGAGQRYDTFAIPANWLLDPEGRIVARNLHGDELRRELARRLK